MHFKITIITGIFAFLIHSLSIATPISQNEIPPQKIEQTRKKKPNFIQKIILKKAMKKIKKDKERASASGVISIIFGSLAFLATLFFLIYFRAAVLLGGVLTGIVAVFTGFAATNSNFNKKTQILGRIGLILGFTSFAVTAGLALYVLFLILRYVFGFFA